MPFFKRWRKKCCASFLTQILTILLHVTELLFSGLSGWFPINLPSVAWDSQGRDAELQADSVLDQVCFMLDDINVKAVVLL